MTVDPERVRLIEEFRDWKKTIFTITQEIVERRAFADGKDHLAGVLKDLRVRAFDAVFGLRISDASGDIQRATELMFNIAHHRHGAIETFTGLEIDLSVHERARAADGRFVQGVELSLYQRSTYDFLARSDAEIAGEYNATASAWQGGFDALESTGLDGMQEVLAVVHAIPRGDDYYYGIVREPLDRDLVAYAEVVFDALIAVEFHRCMHDIVAALVLPQEMVVIVGEHDILSVPHTHYRRPGSPAWRSAPMRDPRMEQIRQQALARLAGIVETARNLRPAGQKPFGRRTS